MKYGIFNVVVRKIKFVVVIMLFLLYLPIKTILNGWRKRCGEVQEENMWVVCKHVMTVAFSAGTDF